MRILCGVIGVLCFAIGAVGQEPRGQETAPPTATVRATEAPLTVERIESLRKAAEESSELDEEAKKKVAEVYRSALAELQRAAELTARTTAYKTDAEAVADRVQQIKQQLKELKANEPALPSGRKLAELEPALSKLLLQLAAQKKTQAATEAEPQLRAQRRKEIRTRLTALPARLAELKKQFESLPANEPELLAAARSIELTARRSALERELPALENELSKYDAEDAAILVRLQSDLSTQEVAVTERHLQVLKEKIKRARASEAEQAVRKARKEAVATDALLESYAQRNRYLAEAAIAITQEFNAADSNLKLAKEQHGRLVHQFESTQKKVESVGLTTSIGVLLRRQRAELPSVSQQRNAVSSRRAMINEAQFELFEYDEERQELANPDQLVKKILADVDVRNTEDLGLLESATRDLLDNKREYLDALIRDYNKYFDTLLALDASEKQIITLTHQYQQFIDERVLWIRSGDVLTSELQFDQADAWVVSSERWEEVVHRFGQDMRQHPLLWSFASLLLVVSILLCKRMKLELYRLGKEVQRPTCFKFGPTLRSAILTVAIAATWPGLIAFLAWRLSLGIDGSPFAKAVDVGLLCICALWFPLELFRQVCRPYGLAEAHFGWPTSATQQLRRHLRWLLLLGLPLTFVNSVFFACDPTHGRDAVERICFILQAAVLASFLSCLLRPGSGVFREYMAYHQGGWIDRLKHLWYWIGVAAPLGIAALAFWGYYYTAQVLASRLYVSMCFVVSLVLVRSLLLRLIVLRRRKLSIQQSRERAAATQAGEPHTASSPAGIVAEPSQADLSAHSVQTQRLLTTGMLASTLVGFWWIWVGVLPALTMLDQWPLWTTTTTVEVEVAEQDAPPTTGPMAKMAESDEPVVSTRTEYQKSSITFSNVALALLIAVITFMSARNVPGLLEMSVLQRLPLDASVRYAVTSLVSYGIVLLGVIVVCSKIGLRWSQIQWLATALTFGLAFGLQEIFANFVAGLIILFERPVRVGDVVTVDDVTGVVSRIRIRATSITNWDRKEYVVPNKEFITGRLLNWTLSDKVNRVVISVGIAYGSDTERARELLLKVANDHPLVLKDPPSVATFEGFGDSSLSFNLRAFLPTMENRLQVIHELHTSIDQAFRQANIEIAFPQRDMHIRTVTEALALPGSQTRANDNRQEAA